MKDGEGKRKVGYETREFRSKGPYKFFRIIYAMKSRAAVGVVCNGLLQLTGANYVQALGKYERITGRQESS